MSVPGLIRPDWPAPARVRAASTTRVGGVSAPPWRALNLARGVGDDEAAVRENRRRVAAALDLPATPCWLRQRHGTAVVDAARAAPGADADAAFARAPGAVGVVLTADCVPVLLCDRDGTRVGVAHAGWRGLAAGVLEATVAALAAPPERLLAWLGPGIGAGAFEVGDEVRAAFLDRDPGAGAALRPSPGGRWLADLHHLARRRLARAGVEAVHGGGRCTYSEPGHFYSHRRDGPATGRMATYAWLADE